MSVKLKNSVIAGMLLLVTIPFLLLTDLFPFMRFGMFAEPVKSSKQLELFEVSYIDQYGKEVQLDPSSVGIEPHFFIYIARNYYYRNEVEKFLEKISRIVNTKNTTEYRMKKIVLPLDKKSEADTTLVFKKVL